MRKGANVSRRQFVCLGMGAVAGTALLGGCGRRATETSGISSDVDDTTDEMLEMDGAVEGESMRPAFDFLGKTVRLNSGYELPLNGLGTYSLHGDTCRSSIRAALECGTRLIDTASAYDNETEVGEAVRTAIADGIVRREEVFVTTKIYPGSEMTDPEPAIQACLDRLDLDYVDLMLLHHPDPNDVVAYQAMEGFVAEGKIRSLGLSCYYVDELTDFLPQVDTIPALVQNEIHPYYQDSDVVPFIQEKGIVAEAWYPLGGRPYDKTLLADAVLTDVAAAHGVSAAQVVLRWHLQRGVVVIPGSGNPSHVSEDARLYDFELSQSDMQRIAELNRNEKHDWY